MCFNGNFFDVKLVNYWHYPWLDTMCKSLSQLDFSWPSERPVQLYKVGSMYGPFSHECDDFDFKLLASSVHPAKTKRIIWDHAWSKTGMTFHRPPCEVTVIVSPHSAKVCVHWGRCDMMKVDVLFLYFKLAKGTLLTESRIVLSRTTSLIPGLR